MFEILVGNIGICTIIAPHVILAGRVRPPEYETIVRNE